MDANNGMRDVIKRSGRGEADERFEKEMVTEHKPTNHT